MPDKFPMNAFQYGTYKTTAPNPHVDLDGARYVLPDVFGTRTFAQAAADTDLDFNDGDTCQVYIGVDGTNWAAYKNVPWNDLTTDQLDLSSGTLVSSEGTISADATVYVYAQVPIDRYWPAPEDQNQGAIATVDANGNLIWAG